MLRTRRRKERTLKELYEITRPISEPKITPVLQGSCRIQGPVDEPNADITKEMESSIASKIFSMDSPNENVRRRAESGSCNVCSAPCSSCRQLIKDIPLTDFVVKSEMVERVDDRMEGCHSSSNESNTHSLCKIKTSDDSMIENVKNKGNLRTSIDAHDAVKMLSNICAGEDISCDSLLSKLGHRSTYHEEIPMHESECNGDDTSCLTGGKESNASVFSINVEENASSRLEQIEILSISSLAMDGGDQQKSLLPNMAKVLPCLEDREAGVIHRNCFSDTLINIPMCVNTEIGTSSSKIVKAVEQNKSDTNREHGLSDCLIGDSNICEPPAQCEANLDGKRISCDSPKVDVMVCDICGDMGRAYLLTICSRCGEGAEHTYCMPVMLDKVPQDEWICEECRFKNCVNQIQDDLKACPFNSKNAPSQRQLNSSSMPDEMDLNESKNILVHCQDSSKSFIQNVDNRSSSKGQSPGRIVTSPKIGSIVKPCVASFDHSTKKSNALGTKLIDSRQACGHLSKPSSINNLETESKVEKLNGFPQQQKQKKVSSLEIEKKMVSPVMMMHKSTSFKTSTSEEPNSKRGSDNLVGACVESSNKVGKMIERRNSFNLVRSKSDPPLYSGKTPFFKGGTISVVSNQKTTTPHGNLESAKRPDGYEEKGNFLNLTLNEPHSAKERSNVLASPKRNTCTLKEAIQAAILKKKLHRTKGVEEEPVDSLLSNSDKKCKSENHIIYNPNPVRDLGICKPHSVGVNNYVHPPLCQNTYTDQGNFARQALSFNISRTSPIPQHDYIWRGNFEVQTAEKLIDCYDGIQAHLSTCASFRVHEIVKKFSSGIQLVQVDWLSSWPSQFLSNCAKEEDIALYFFAKDMQSYELNYMKLLENMLRNNLALKGNFDGVELLVFPSTRLPDKSQRWNGLLFLWGVFGGRRDFTPSTSVKEKVVGSHSFAISKTSLSLNIDPCTLSNTKMFTSNCMYDNIDRRISDEPMHISSPPLTPDEVGRRHQNIASLNEEPKFKDEKFSTNSPSEESMRIDIQFSRYYSSQDFNDDGMKNVECTVSCSNQREHTMELGKGMKFVSVDAPKSLDRATTFSAYLDALSDFKEASSINLNQALSRSSNMVSTSPVSYNHGINNGTALAVNKGKKISTEKYQLDRRMKEMSFLPYISGSSENHLRFEAQLLDEESPPESSIPNLELALGDEKKLKKHKVLPLIVALDNQYQGDDVKVPNGNGGLEEPGSLSLSLGLQFAKQLEPETSNVNPLLLCPAKLQF